MPGEVRLPQRYVVKWRNTLMRDIPLLVRVPFAKLAPSSSDKVHVNMILDMVGGHLTFIRGNSAHRI